MAIQLRNTKTTDCTLRALTRRGKENYNNEMKINIVKVITRVKFVRGQFIISDQIDQSS